MAKDSHLYAQGFPIMPDYMAAYIFLCLNREWFSHIGPPCKARLKGMGTLTHRKSGVGELLKIVLSWL